MINENTCLRLLVVEDNPGDYVLLKSYIKRAGLAVETILWAKQLFEVESVLNQGKVDLAFLDLRLPDSSGINSFIELNKQLHQTPIIVLSGLNDMAVTVEAISLGAQDYLIKGEFDEKLLIKSIQYSIQRKKTQELEKQLANQQLHQQKLTTALTIEIQEKERDEIGKELHDNINQILATAKMYLGIAKNKENQKEDLLLKSYDYINDAMEEIRKLSKILVAPSLGDTGLVEALKRLVNEVNDTYNVQVCFENKVESEKEIDKNIELMLYRVTQEQLNNIRKHAKADRVKIIMKTNEKDIFLSISGDGVGFDPLQKASGIGLRNITNRVSFYSGNIKIISAPGQGCTLAVQIPL